MMKSLDDAVGSIMNALDEKRLNNNTIIIFTSDNGGERFSEMVSYKGHKMTLWEGGIRVPAFVKWPGVIAPNTVSKQVATTMDWTASILHVAGARVDAAFPLDGINIFPIVSGQQKELERTVYWRISERAQQKAIRDGQWKYLQDEKGEYLFNLSTDPVENHNLRDKEPATFTQLKNKYALWESTVLKPLPAANN